MPISVKSLSTRIYLLVISFLVFSSIYYIYTAYSSLLEIKEKDNLERLKGIVATIAATVDTKDFETLLKKYPNIDDIKNTEDDSIYREIHYIFKMFEQNNNLNTAIYTLTRNNKNEYFFGVTSAEKPYYRHVYDTYPEILANNYQQGGTIPIYEDENGTWLSAFAPIKSADGKTLGVVQADRMFEHFNEEAKKVLYKDMIIFSLAILGLSVILIRILSKVLKNEENSKRLIENSTLIIKEKNYKITKSIRYAKRIQDAMFQIRESSLGKLSDFFQVYMPKDIVSGDFIWVHEEKNQVYIAVADCTGHGVPGALLSILGASSLKEIVVSKNVKHPDEVLFLLDKKIKELLNQDEENNLSDDGMDIGLCLIDYSDMTLEYAGAHHEIIIANEEKINTIRGDKRGLGGSYTRQLKPFTNHVFEVDKGDKIYLYSDGITDQFGKNEKGKIEKFKRRRLIELIKNIHANGLNAQKQNIEKALHNWRSDEPQLDDISFFAMQI